MIILLGCHVKVSLFLCCCNFLFSSESNGQVRHKHSSAVITYNTLHPRTVAQVFLYDIFRGNFLFLLVVFLFAC